MAARQAPHRSAHPAPRPHPPLAQRAAAAAAGDSSRLPWRTLRLAAPLPSTPPAPPRCLRFSQAPGVSAACVEGVCQGNSIVLCECVCLCVRALSVGCAGLPALRFRPPPGKDGRLGASLFRERFPAPRLRLRRERKRARLAAGLQKIYHCPPGWICSCSREDGFSVRSRVAADSPPWRISGQRGVR